METVFTEPHIDAPSQPVCHTSGSFLLCDAPITTTEKWLMLPQLVTCSFSSTWYFKGVWGAQVHWLKHPLESHDS